MQTQPLVFPTIKPFVGEMPDIFAHRMAGEMVSFLHMNTQRTWPLFKATLKRHPPPASLIKQRQWLQRLINIRAPILLGVLLDPCVVKGSFRAQFMLAIEPESCQPHQLDICLWEVRRERSGKPVEKKTLGVATVSKHAVARLMQRCTHDGQPIHDMRTLHLALRDLARALSADRINRLYSKEPDPKSFTVQFPGGRAVLAPSSPLAFSRATVVTIMEPERIDECPDQDPELKTSMSPAAPCAAADGSA